VNADAAAEVLAEAGSLPVFPLLATPWKPATTAKDDGMSTETPGDVTGTSWTAPHDLDPQILELCTALNALPGIETYGSCCGHGERPVHVSILFRDPEDLAVLLYLLDPCHGAPQGWRVEVHSDCAASGPFYGVEGPAGAYDDGRAIAALITKYLEES
jgi:hypothetical protein